MGINYIDIKSYMNQPPWILLIDHKTSTIHVDKYAMGIHHGNTNIN